MKRIAVVLMCITVITIFAIQTGKTMESDSVKKEVLKNIQSLWKGWQDQNPEPFKQLMSQDALTITGQGVTTMSDLFKQMEGKQCAVKSFSIDESGARLTKIDDNTYVITYKADQEATCSGIKSPSPVMVSEVWSNKDGKWKGYFYQETHLASK
ncbi:MAG TPA: nuclear transport factor 2 family protein [Acidobacteriota bacterium]|nr:nuclear transport factor 2 family protein [Acidobacteriota bacterium]